MIYNKHFDNNLQLHVGPIAQLEEVTAKDEDDFFAEHSNESNNNGFFNQDGNSEKVGSFCERNLKPNAS